MKGASRNVPSFSLSELQCTHLDFVIPKGLHPKSLQPITHTHTQK